MFLSVIVRLSLDYFRWSVTRSTSRTTYGRSLNALPVSSATVTPPSAATSMPFYRSTSTSMPTTSKSGANSECLIATIYIHMFIHMIIHMEILSILPSVSPRSFVHLETIAGVRNRRERVYVFVLQVILKRLASLRSRWSQTSNRISNEEIQFTSL